MIRLKILLLLTALLINGMFSIAGTAQSATQPLAIDLDDVNWGPPGGGDGVPVGVRTARQGIDPISQGITYYAMFPAGSHFDLHWHSHDEFVSVVRGNVTLVLGEESHELQAGAYVVIPGRMNHSWDVPSQSDVVILVRRAGPADFNFVEAR